MPTLTDHGNMLTLEMLLTQIPALKERTVRHWLQSNPHRFRERCVVLVGRKLFFNLDALGQWLQEHQG